MLTGPHVCVSASWPEQPIERVIPSLTDEENKNPRCGCTQGCRAHERQGAPLVPESIVSAAGCRSHPGILKFVSRAGSIQSHVLCSGHYSLCCRLIGPTQRSLILYQLQTAAPATQPGEVRRRVRLKKLGPMETLVTTLFTRNNFRQAGHFQSELVSYKSWVGKGCL